MTIVTIDFETYYDKDYSLKKLTTEEYINDPRFQVIGAAIKIGKHARAYWVNGSQAEAVFVGGQDYSGVSFLGHNIAFDGAILAWKYGIRPKRWLDTLSMSRIQHSALASRSLDSLCKHYNLGSKGLEIHNALGKRLEDFTASELKAYGDYCINDVELTYKLYKCLKGDWFTPHQEDLIDIIIRMFTEPSINIDNQLLEVLLKNIDESHNDVLSPLSGDNNSKIKMLRSNTLFAKELAANGVSTPTKISPTTGKETFAFAKTDLEFINLLTNDNPKIRDLVRARLAIKTTIEKSRAERLLSVGNRSAKLPILLNYAGARTFRLSGGDKLNLQNLPSSGGIRNALCAPKGYSIVVADSSQIEPRLLAFIAGQNNLLDAFREKRDVYIEFASQLYGKEITKADATERFVGKTCILGLGYCTGAVKLRHTLALGNKGPAVHITETDAIQYVRLYRQRNRAITALWEKCNRAIINMCCGSQGAIASPLLSYDNRGILLPNGLRLIYSDITRGADGYEYTSRTNNKGSAITQKIYGGKLTENIIQAIAGIIIAEQMVAVSKRYQVAFAVHDEIIVVCRDSQVVEAKAFITNIMSTSPVWAPTLPLSCEVGVGKTYGDAK